MAFIQRTIQFALNTSTGTQDITIPGIGETCKGYALWISSATSNASESTHASLTVGMVGTDGTTVSSGGSCQDAQAAGNGRRFTNNATINFWNNDVIDCVIAHSAFITDGFRINITNAPASAWLVNAWVIYGDDANVEVQMPGFSGVDTTETVITFGQQTDYGLAATARLGTIPDDSNHHINTWGMWAHNGGTPEQGMQGFETVDGQDPTNCSEILFNDRVAADLRTAPGDTVRGSMEVTASSSTTVTFTTRVNSSMSTLATALMSVNTGGLWDAKVGVFDLPVGTGTTAYTDPAFPCQFLAFMYSRMTAYVDPTSGVQESGSTLHVGSADSESNEFCIGYHSEGGAATSNCGSYTNNAVASQRSETGTEELSATIDSLDATGWTFNVTSAPTSSTEAKGLYLAIEGAGAVVAQDLATRSGKRRKNETIRRRISRSLRRLAHIWSILPMIPPPEEPPAAPMMGRTGNFPGFVRRRMRAGLSYKDLLEMKRLQEKATRKSMDKNIDKGMK